MRKIAALLIICAAFASACTGGRWVRTTVAEQHEFNVTLEQQQEKGIVIQQKYAHPYEVDISALEKLMGDLHYSEKSGLRRTEKQNPVFQPVEIDRLAPVLAATLAKAEASQRIRFTSFNQGQSLIFSVPRKTEGVIFIEPAGRLNFAFNYINANRQSSETTGIAPVYSSADPLKIQVSDTIIAATAPYAELHKFATDKQAPMWVVVNLEKLKEAISTATVPPVKAAEDVVPAVAPTVGSKDTAVEKTVPDKASEDMLKEDIRNKLKYLKELLDEGLISEQDYTVKKKELLDKIN
jgi:hypothetical protein